MKAKRINAKQAQGLINKDMKTKYIYKGEEILHSTFISLCRKISVNGGRKFTTLEKLQ